MDNLRRLKASLQLFNELECCSSNLNGDFDTWRSYQDLLALVDVDKMRCHIINCLTALYTVETQKRISDENVSDENYESVKGKVFNAAISMIGGNIFDSNEAVVNTILSSFPFPDEGKLSDERSWLPQHFALALGVRNKISEDDIRIMLSVDPLLTHRLSKREEVGEFIKCDESGRCALHLVAQYSESLELLEDILQIDHKMTKMVSEFEYRGKDITPLGFLCSRLPHFPTFYAMALTLTEVDSSIDGVFSVINHHLISYEDCLNQDISPGSRGAKSLVFLGTLLDANPAVAKHDDSRIFNQACINLRGELFISVLLLFLSKNSTGVKVVNDDGDLPIHDAAYLGCLELVKFLHRAYPESISILEAYGNSLLTLAAYDNTSDIADVIGKVQYLCDQCPALIHLKNIEGNTALHILLTRRARFLFKCVKILCNKDWTVVRDKCTPSGITEQHSGMLPLHYLLDYRPSISEVSEEGDCFRLLLRLYPAAAGIKDGHSRSPYDMAVSNDLSAYFLRLLLAADPDIEPVRRHDLNFAARRQGMFLAFRAISSVLEPSIWSKMRLKGRDLLQHVVSYL
jgi:ankyrin repeat protein